MKYYVNTIKLSVYFFIISFCTAFAINISSHFASQIVIFDMFLLKPYQILTIGMIMGPLVTLLVLCKKGSYNTSVFIVYLLESSTVALGFYSPFTLATIIGNLTLGIAITSSMVMCPILTFYLRGPIHYLSAFLCVLTSYFLGFILSNPFCKLPGSLAISGTPIIYVIILLLIGFFTVFSAWKGRLVLLK